MPGAAADREARHGGGRRDGDPRAPRGDQGYEVLLVTGDKDMLQVVDERVTVLWPQARGENYLRMDPAAVDGKWG